MIYITDCSFCRGNISFRLVLHLSFDLHWSLSISQKSFENEVKRSQELKVSKLKEGERTRRKGKTGAAVAPKGPRENSEGKGRAEKES